jgi:hypothetical protein
MSPSSCSTCWRSNESSGKSAEWCTGRQLTLERGLARRGVATARLRDDRPVEIGPQTICSGTGREAKRLAAVTPRRHFATGPSSNLAKSR